MATVDSGGHQENEEVASEGLLKTAARAIGSAVGIAAAKTGIAHSGATHGARIVNGKFQKSHRDRLPRKLKKAHKKTRGKDETAA